MIPSYGTYFSDLLPLRDDPYFQVSLTVEGHAAQHDVLYRAFGNGRDNRVRKNFILHSSKAKRLLGVKADWRDGENQNRKKRLQLTGVTRSDLFTGLDPNTGETLYFAGPSVAAKHMNGNSSAISAVADGHRRQHLGWKFWRVVDKEE